MSNPAASMLKMLKQLEAAEKKSGGGQVSCQFAGRFIDIGGVNYYRR